MNASRQIETENNKAETNLESNRSNLSEILDKVNDECNESNEELFDSESTSNSNEVSLDCQKYR